MQHSILLLLFLSFSSLSANSATIRLGLEGDNGLEKSELSVLYLEQNYPNPFKKSTGITFRLTKSRTVQLKVFDVLGVEVTLLVDDVLEEGQYTVMWNGTDHFGERLPTGSYFFQLTDGYTTITRTTLMTN